MGEGYTSAPMGWECEQLELAEMPQGLKKCTVNCMPGIAPQ